MKQKLFFLITILLIFTNYIQSQTGCWKTFSVSSSHTLAIKNDGTLWAWGSGAYGQLGNGISNQTSYVPIQIGTDTNWTEVYTSSLTCFAIKENGSLWAWGNNLGGQYGNGTTTQSFVPIQIGNEYDWKMIASNSFCTIGIKTNGTMWGWGQSDYGLLGNGTGQDSFIPIQIGTSTNWKQVSAGTYHCLAIQNNGSLWAWGYNQGCFGNGTVMSSQIPIQIGTQTNWLEVSGGNAFTTAIKTDGSLWVAGTNSSGEHGNGTNEGYSNTFLRIGTANNWSKVYSGWASILAIKNNGTLWAWGTNFSGNLGIGTNSNAYTPTQVGTSNQWKMASIYSSNSGGIQNNGNLHMTGENGIGQNGNGTNQDNNTPTEVTCPESLSNSNAPTDNLFVIYPNPATNWLYLENHYNETIKKIVIYDILGNIVLENSGNQTNIKIDYIATGVYLLKITTETNKQEIFRFLKQ